MLAEIAAKFTDQQEAKVEQAVDTIKTVVQKVSEKTRRDLLQTIGMFEGQEIMGFYSILLTSDEIDYDVVDDVLLSMGEDDLRTEIIRRLNLLGIFNIKRNA